MPHKRPSPLRSAVFSELYPSIEHLFLLMSLAHVHPHAMHSVMKGRRLVHTGKAGRYKVQCRSALKLIEEI